MSASMTPELRALMRHRPLGERFRLWWLLRALNRLENAYENSFVGDAGYAISNIISGGRPGRILMKIRAVEDLIAEITVPVMQGRRGG